MKTFLLLSLKKMKNMNVVINERQYYVNECVIIWHEFRESSKCPSRSDTTWDSIFSLPWPPAVATVIFHREPSGNQWSRRRSNIISILARFRSLSLSTHIRFVLRQSNRASRTMFFLFYFILFFFFYNFSLLTNRFQLVASSSPLSPSTTIIQSPMDIHE